MSAGWPAIAAHVATWPADADRMFLSPRTGVLAVCTDVHDDQRLLEQKMLRDHRSHATGATPPRGHGGQVKQGEQEGLHPRDRVGQTSGATQRCLILESARQLGIRDAQADSPERIGNSRRTG